jgi:hypothetical protein
MRLHAIACDRMRLHGITCDCVSSLSPGGLNSICFQSKSFFCERCRSDLIRSHEIANLMSTTVQVLENASGTRSGTESLPKVFLHNNCEQISYNFFRFLKKEKIRSGTHFTQQNVFLLFTVVVTKHVWLYFQSRFPKTSSKRVSSSSQRSSSPKTTTIPPSTMTYHPGALPLQSCAYTRHPDKPPFCATPSTMSSILLSTHTPSTPSLEPFMYLWIVLNTSSTLMRSVMAWYTLSSKRPSPNTPS